MALGWSQFMLYCHIGKLEGSWGRSWASQAHLAQLLILQDQLEVFTRNIANKTRT